MGTKVIFLLAHLQVPTKYSSVISQPNLHKTQKTHIKELTTYCLSKVYKDKYVGKECLIPVLLLRRVPGKGWEWTE